ncbi:hypothetical protein D1007_20077 [Hordeum vulgare]|uniref:F-box domain-containing protein n=1 Tax=Hordeum vulgare subsp. vulgare TaxID=112509 RepID=A0A8I6YX93_HORVV|nr:hypothetical protein D1007_20077 [Hordeum vulgare]
MAAGVRQVLDWFAGSEAILRAERAVLSASTTAGGEDRISALHNHLLRDIVSRLHARDAARTAALASRWRHLWRSTTLVFHDALSCQPEHAAAVARALAGHPGPFATVSIRYCDFRCQSPELAECPRLLAAKGVRDLVLVNAPADLDHLPDAPAEVLSCAPLRRLFLGYFRFPDTGAGLPGREEGLFRRLRELILLSVDMPDYDHLDRLLARSPVLDTLVVVQSQIFHHIHLRSQSLKCALLWSYYVHEVALKLESLTRSRARAPWFRVSRYWR